MKMVAHQNKTENRGLKTSRRFTEQLEEASAIALVMENGLPRVATRAKMIDGILNLYPQRPRYSYRPASLIPMSNV
jgi:hypothetical protein